MAGLWAADGIFSESEPGDPGRGPSSGTRAARRNANVRSKYARLDSQNLFASGGLVLCLLQGNRHRVAKRKSTLNLFEVNEAFWRRHPVFTVLVFGLLVLAAGVVCQLEQ